MKIQMLKIGISLCLVLASLTQSIGQTTEKILVRDFETWSSLDLSYKFNKKLEIGLSQELRLKDNSSTIDQFFTESFIEYKIAKPIRVGAALRYLRENDTEGNIQGYETHLRYAFYSSFQHKLDRLSLKYRVQYQSKKEAGLGDGVTVDPVEKVRLKVGGKYNFPKWKLDPVVSFELFRTLGSVNDFSKIRGTIGTKYELKKANDLVFFYRFEKELKVTNPQWTNIIGLKYQLKFKRN